ncbi:MAG: hypothetical protein WC856_07820 [Methylococcaceae bacterium]|jgi:hypothetical protein
MNTKEKAEKFLTSQGFEKNTTDPEYLGWYINKNTGERLMPKIEQAFSFQLDKFLDSWDEDSATDEEIDKINELCDMRTIKSFSSADDKPSFV